MDLPLQDLIKEATQLVYVPSCSVNGHEWVDHDCARPCPRSGDNSQQVYVCGLCGEMDYGDPGGPGFRDCFKEGPCFEDCIPPPDVEEVQS